MHFLYSVLLASRSSLFLFASRTIANGTVLITFAALLPEVARGIYFCVYMYVYIFMEIFPYVYVDMYAKVYVLLLVLLHKV